MKKKITGLLVILAIMAVIPLVFSKNKIQFDAESVFQNPNSGKTALITSAAAFHFRENYSDETMKALILILNSNYKAGKLNKKETRFLNLDEVFDLLSATVKQLKSFPGFIQHLKC